MNSNKYPDMSGSEDRSRTRLSRYIHGVLLCSVNPFYNLIVIILISTIFKHFSKSGSFQFGSRLSKKKLFHRLGFRTPLSRTTSSSTCPTMRFVITRLSRHARSRPTSIYCPEVTPQRLEKKESIFQVKSNIFDKY